MTYAAVPVMSQATITQTDGTTLLNTIQDLQLNCNATDADTNYIAYNYILYINGTETERGNDTGEQNITTQPTHVWDDAPDVSGNTLANVSFDDNYIDKWVTAADTYWVNFTYQYNLTQVPYQITYSHHPADSNDPLNLYEFNLNQSCINYISVNNNFTTYMITRRHNPGISDFHFRCLDPTLQSPIKVDNAWPDHNKHRETDIYMWYYQGHQQNTAANVQNISNNMSGGDTVILSCQGFDGNQTSAWMNSSEYTVIGFLLEFSENVTFVYQDLSETYQAYGDSIEYNSTSSNGVLRVHMDQQAGNWYPNTYHILYAGQVINESIEIHNNPDTHVWFRITDAMGTNLEHAQLRVYQSLPANGTAGYLFYSQLLTDANGLTDFYLDSNRYTKIEVEVDGYQTNQDWSDYVGHNNSYDIPYTIVMTRENSGVQSFLFHTNYITTDKTQDQTGFIQSSDSTSVFTVNTQYRIDNSLPSKSMFTGQIDEYQTTLPEYAHTFQLVSGTDFNHTNTDDITLFIYDDSVQIVNRTIEYISTNASIIIDLNDYTTTTEKKTIAVLLILGLLTFVIIMQFMFRSVNQDIGFHTYMVGMVMLAFIFTPFIIPAIITAVYYAMKPFRRLIGIE